MSLIQFDANQLLLQIGGLRGEEWIIIAVIVVVVFFGARKIPDIARSIGRASGEFEKGSRGQERNRRNEEVVGKGRIKQGKRPGEAYQCG